MKKVLVALLATVLALGCVLPCLAEEDDYVIFTPTLIGAMEQTAEGWMENGMTRALLTVLFGLDMIGSDEIAAKYDMSGFDGNAVLNSYVGVNENGFLVIGMYDDAKVYLGSCRTDGNVAGIIITDSLGAGETILTKTLDTLCTEYYRNSESDLMEVAQMITDAINSGS